MQGGEVSQGALASVSSGGRQRHGVPNATQSPVLVWPRHPADWIDVLNCGWPEFVTHRALHQLKRHSAVQAHTIRTYSYVRSAIGK